MGLTLLTVPEAAEMARVSDRFIRDAYRTGGLRVVRMGCRVLIKPEHLEAWIASKETGGDR